MSRTDYRKIIYIGGSKGGSGKSLTSAALATGLYYLGVTSVVAATDPEEKARNDLNRKYFTKEAYTGDKLKVLVEKFIGLPVDRKAALIIDGVANKSNQDSVIAKFADMTIFPTKGSPGDFDRTKTYLKAIDESYWLLNDEETNNAMRMDKVNLQIEEHLGQFANRRLNSVKRCASLKEFSSFKENISLSTEAVIICQSLAIDVYSRLGFDALEMEREFQAKKREIRIERAKEIYAKNQANLANDNQAQSDATE